MTPSEYQRRAMLTQANQKTILSRITDWGVRPVQLLMAAVGLQDEVGEIASAVKKHVEYGQPLDTVNLQEEVGDALWRLVQICDAAGLTLGGCMASNLEKLAIRYPQKFTEERAAESGRDRAAEAEAVRWHGVCGTVNVNGVLLSCDLPVGHVGPHKFPDGATYNDHPVSVVQDGHGFGHLVCTECWDSGWKLSTGDPQNGWNRNAERCSKGCPSRCGVCGNDDCDNPNGQH